MDWILDHLQFVIAVAAAFAYWLNSRKQQQAARENEDEGRPQAELHDEESAARARAERARQIREEIQRKIAERQGGPVVHPANRRTPAPAAVPRPRSQPVVQAPRQPARPDLYAALAEQQRRIEAEQRRFAEARAQAEAIRARAGSAHGADYNRRAATTARRTRGAFIRTQLRDPAGFKYTVVLREVLGPPVSLQNR